MDSNKLKSDGIVIGYDHRDDANGIDSEMIARAGVCVCVCVCVCICVCVCVCVYGFLCVV